MCALRVTCVCITDYVLGIDLAIDLTQGLLCLDVELDYSYVIMSTLEYVIGRFICSCVHLNKIKINKSYTHTHTHTHTHIILNVL